MATVDILMATYNGELFLREQIESIQAQTFSDWRLLVSDDCSSDGTVEIIKELAETDSRIVLISEGERHGSAKSNFMFLLKKSEAPYVMFCDQDDVWLSNKIKLSISCIRELELSYGSASPVMAFTDMKVVDSKLNVIDDSFESLSKLNPNRTSFPELLAQSIGAGCTMIFNDCAAQLALRVSNIEQIIMHDWWLSIICSAFGKIAYIDYPTSLYRQHENNEVGARKFSPTFWLGHIKLMEKSQSAISNQAELFAQLYSDLLLDSQIEIAMNCAKCCSGSSFENVARLARSGTWKQGSRKLGQLLVAVLNGFMSR